MVIQTDSSYNPNWKQFSYNHEKSVLQSSLSSAYHHGFLIIIYKMLFMCAMSDIAGLGQGLSATIMLHLLLKHAMRT